MKNRGKALEKLKSFEEIKIEPLTCHADNSIPCIEGCNMCIDACMYGAISRKDNRIHIYDQRCTVAACVLFSAALKIAIAMVTSVNGYFNVAVLVKGYVKAKNKNNCLNFLYFVQLSCKSGKCYNEDIM